MPVERDAYLAKLWLNPVRLYDGAAFPRVDVANIVLLPREHEAALLRSWHDYSAD